MLVSRRVGRILSLPKTSQFLVGILNRSARGNIGKDGIVDDHDLVEIDVESESAPSRLVVDDESFLTVADEIDSIVAPIS